MLDWIKSKYLFVSLNVFFTILIDSRISKSNNNEEKIINNIVNALKDRIKKKKIFVNRGVITESCGEVLHYIDKNKLLMIDIGYGDCSMFMTSDKYYFNKNKLIMVEREVIEFGHLTKSFGNLDKINLKKIYLKDNKVFKILENISLNNKTIKKNQLKNYKEENENIRLELTDFIHLSHLFNKPKFRIYKGKGELFKTIYLSGKEKKLKIYYKLENDKDKIIFYDQNIPEIKISKNEINNIHCKEYYIFEKLSNPKLKESVRETELSLEIKTYNPESKWWLKIEFEGDEIQIG